MRFKTIIIPFLTFALVSTLIISFIPKNKIEIEGVWSVAEVQTIKSDGSKTITFPKESIVIFSQNYYSFCWTSQTYKNRNWSLSDSVKLSRFNQSIVNSGTFEFKNSILTTKAKFAMHPMFVDGLATFRCSIHGDTLILTGLNVVSSDNISHPVYASGSHFVSKLLKIKNK
jgi:hypothetical protein